jgi:hypothetical protein
VARPSTLPALCDPQTPQTRRSVRRSVNIVKREVPVISYAVKSHGEVELQLHSFLTSALDGVNSQPHASPALPPEEAPLVPII